MLMFSLIFKHRGKKVLAPLGASLIVLSSLFYASYGIWTKLMGDFFEGYTASALRSVLVLVILLPITFAFQKFEPVNWKRNGRLLIGLSFTSLFIWGPLYFAILHAGIGISLTINYACIVIGMFFFAWLLLRERFTRDKWLSATLGLSGLGLVFSPNITSIGLLALGAAALSGVSVAAGLVMLKQLSYNPMQTTVVLWVVSVLANAFMALVFGENVPAIGLRVQWLYLIIFAAASVIASWTYITGLKYIEAGAAGILGLLEVVFGILFGVLFFSERPGIIVMIGAITIITAAAIPYIKDYNLKRGTLE